MNLTSFRWERAQLSRYLPGALEPDGADRAWLRARVGPLVGVERSGPAESVTQEESFAARRQLLESFAEQSPVVLVFEDLHWATDAMLAFVDHLAEWLTDLPLLVVVTARPELLALLGHHGSLTDDEVAIPWVTVPAAART